MLLQMSEILLRHTQFDVVGFLFFVFHFRFDKSVSERFVCVCTVWSDRSFIMTILLLFFFFRINCCIYLK